jgi:phosphohistidine phosphatase
LIKHLALLRHAETQSVHESGGDDYGRKLTGNGMRQCEAIAAHLEGLHFDLALCSPARRTMETAKLALAGHYTKLVSADSLYNATASHLIDRIARLDKDTTSIVVIAHNPGISQCAEALASGMRKPSSTMTPGTLVTFHFTGQWRDIGAGACQLADVFIP